MELRENFSVLPPAELNEHLLTMVGKLPIIPAGAEGWARDDKGEEFQETFLRRRRSEPLRLFKASLTLMNTRSSATTAGKEYSIMAFEEAYCAGSRGLLSWLTDEVRGDPAGFYSVNLNTVEEIERKGYRGHSSRLLRHTKYLEEKFGEGIDPNNHEVVFSAKWRKQFIEQYGNEP